MAVLIGWFALMYLANTWMPLYRDDYWSALIWKTGEHIQSMDDVFLSLERYYMMHGGRLVSFFIQFAFMLIGKFWFNIANALVFSAMCAVMVMHARRKLACLDRAGMLFTAGAFMWLGLSHFGEVAIWLCGSTVYLWTGLLTAIFLLPYNLALADTISHHKIFLTSIMLPLGAVAACSVENLTATTSLLVIWCTWQAHKRGIFAPWMAMGAVGSLIGSVACITAPGNYVRIEEDNDRSWLFHFLNQLSGNLEMILYMLPIILTLVLAVRLLYLASAEKRNIFIPSMAKDGCHYILLAVLIVSIVSFITTGFLWRAIKATVVFGVFIPLGFTDEVLFDRFNNTMQGFEEALIYIVGVTYVYLMSIRSLDISKRRIRKLKEKISHTTLVKDFPTLRYVAFLVGLCLLNNLFMLGAPSFPGRALFSSSVILAISAMAVLNIPEVNGPLLRHRAGRIWRKGSTCILGSIILATFVLLHGIWQEDSLRLAYIAQQAKAGQRVASVPYSEFPEQRRVLRHVCYDDFDTGLTRDPVCDYFGLKDIHLDRTMKVADIPQQLK